MRQAGKDATPLSDAYDVYDPAANQWTAGRLAVPHDQASAVVVGDQAFFAGGSTNAPADADPNAALPATDVVEVYDAATGKWSVAHLSVPRRAIVAVPAAGRFALFAGGFSANPDGAAYDVYDTVLHTWTSGQLGAVLYTFVDAPVGIATVGDLTFLSVEDAVDVFDAASGQWSSHALRGSGGGQALTVGHKVLFGEGSLLDVYDADTGQWSIARLRGENGNGYAGVTVGGRAVYVTRPRHGEYRPSGGDWVIIGRPYVDVLAPAS